MTTESLIFIAVAALIGLVVGGFMGWMFASKEQAQKSKTLELDLLNLKNQNEMKLLEQQKDTEAIQTQHQQLKEVYQALQVKFEGLQKEKFALETDSAVVQEKLKQLETMQQEWSLGRKQEFETFMQQSLNLVQSKLREESTKDVAERQKAFDEKLNLLVKPLSETVTNYQKDVQRYYASLDEQVKLNAEQLKQTAQAANKLSTALNSNQARGNWGEVELMRILELSGLKEGVSYFTQEVQANGKKPDVRVLLPDNRSIFIDAKSLRLDLELLAESEFATEETLKNKRKQLAKALESAINSLDGREYLEHLSQGETANFIVLFVPRESMLSEALAHDMNLFEKAYRKSIILSGPFNLLGMLKMIHQGWTMAKFSEDAEKILELGQALYKQAVTFSEHFDKLGKDIDKLSSDHSKAWASFAGSQGLVKKIQALEDYGLQHKTAKSLPEEFYQTKEPIQTIETQPLLTR